MKTQDYQRIEQKLKKIMTVQEADEKNSKVGYRLEMLAFEAQAGIISLESFCSILNQILQQELDKSTPTS